MILCNIQYMSVYSYNSIDLRIILSCATATDFVIIILYSNFYAAHKIYDFIVHAVKPSY